MTTAPGAKEDARCAGNPQFKATNPKKEDLGFPAQRAKELDPCGQ
jgi:hypothetical protein